MRRYVNLAITMLIGGLWHGAGWTFVMWGGLHSLFLVINHFWRGIRLSNGRRFALPSLIGHAITLFLVVVAWVPFRAESFDATSRILAAMAGMSGIALPETSQAFLPSGGLSFRALEHVGTPQAAMIGLAMFVALALPNVQVAMAQFSPALDRPHPYRGLFAKAMSWRPDVRWAMSSALIAVASLVWTFIRVNPNEFLYFQF